MTTKAKCTWEEGCFIALTKAKRSPEKALALLNDCLKSADNVNEQFKWCPDDADPSDSSILFGTLELPLNDNTACFIKDNDTLLDLAHRIGNAPVHVACRKVCVCVCACPGPLLNGSWCLCMS